MVVGFGYNDKKELVCCDYAMLIRPKKAETLVHGCLHPGLFLFAVDLRGNILYQRGLSAHNIRDFKKRRPEQRRRQLRKISFLVWFSVLDHRYIYFPFRLCTRFSNRKRWEVQPRRQTSIVKVCCLKFTLSTEPQKRVFRGVSVKTGSSLHSNVQLLFSLIKTIVLYRSRLRCHPRILKSLISGFKLATSTRVLSFYTSFFPVENWFNLGGKEGNTKYSNWDLVAERKNLSKSLTLSQCMIRLLKLPSSLDYTLSNFGLQ